MRKPESFLKRSTAPWNHLPAWVIKAFGSLLLLGAIGFLHGFAVKISGVLAQHRHNRPISARLRA